MDRVLAAAVFGVALAAGCTSTAPRQLVGGGAVLSSVSIDEAWVAVLTGAERLDTGAHLGALAVAPASGAAPTPLDGHSSGGTFNRGTTLWYLGGVQVVNEPDAPGMPAVVEHVYGGLYVWSAATGAPAQVGSIVRDYAVAQNGTAALFMDWSAASNDPGTTGTLVAVAAASCGGGACKRTVLAEGVTAAQTAWRLSSDGSMFRSIESEWRHA